MALPFNDTVGTATLTNGSATMTGQGTSWLTTTNPGDNVIGHYGQVGTVLSVNSNTSITLIKPWQGTTQTALSYEIRFLSDVVRMQATTRALLDKLTNGNVDAFAGLALVADRLPYANGNGTLALATFTTFARSLLDDASQSTALTTLGATPVGRATYGGTANAITLTSPVALVAGNQVRFRATAANTGAATIALNGGAAVACRTITGVALPAGYIRTDVDTVATYDGTFWVLDRQIERGSNANGNFVRFADGFMVTQTTVAAVDITTAQASMFRSGPTSATLPATFTTIDNVFVEANSAIMWGSGIASGGAAVQFSLFYTASTTGRTAYITAIGRWF